jgi:hypothetical protein
MSQRTNLVSGGLDTGVVGAYADSVDAAAS